jgi:hypothetical protein
MSKLIDCDFNQFLQIIEPILDNYHIEKDEKSTAIYSICDKIGVKFNQMEEKLDRLEKTNIEISEALVKVEKAMNPYKIVWISTNVTSIHSI